MAKLLASESAVKIVKKQSKSMVDTVTPRISLVERFWRDSKLCTIGEGTSEIQRSIIAKKVYAELPA